MRLVDARFVHVRSTITAALWESDGTFSEAMSSVCEGISVKASFDALGPVRLLVVCLIRLGLVRCMTGHSVNHS